MEKNKDRRGGCIVNMASTAGLCLSKFYNLS